MELRDSQHAGNGVLVPLLWPLLSPQSRAGCARDGAGAAGRRSGGCDTVWRMPSRRPTKAELRRIIAIDLLADWRECAQPLPPPASKHDWRYYGVVTIDGVRGALAWRAGGFGISTGASVRELGMWDCIKLTRLLEARLPGIERVPKFEPATMADTSCFMRPRRAK